MRRRLQPTSSYAPAALRRGIVGDIVGVRSNNGRFSTLSGGIFELKLAAEVDVNG